MVVDYNLHHIVFIYRIFISYCLFIICITSDINLLVFVDNLCYMVFINRTLFLHNLHYIFIYRTLISWCLLYRLLHRVHLSDICLTVFVHNLHYIAHLSDINLLVLLITSVTSCSFIGHSFRGVYRKFTPKSFRV